MKRNKFALVVGLVLSNVVAPARGTDAVPPTNNQSDEYRTLLQQWKDLLAEIAQVQTKNYTMPPAQRQMLTPLVAKADTLAPRLQAAAEKAFLADEKNREFADLLFVMAINHLRKDNYEESLRLAKLLIEHGYPEVDAQRVAASSALAIMQLDEVQKLLEALGGKLSNDPEVQKLAAQIAHYRPLWEREQKLRAAEAQADDLPRVKLHTSQGDIVVELFENEAPNSVANFISLVEKGFYDGVQFHRVLPAFMAQTGDPSTKPAAGTADGPGYTIADECFQPNRRDHFRGSLSMAHGTPRDSGGSQFFLTFAPTGHLDGQHTVFGRVIEGLDVLSKLQRFDPQKPTLGVTLDKITKAEVLRKRDHPYEPKTLPAK